MSGTKRKRVLVTGGAGFIGSHTVDALLAKKYAVEIIDNLSSGHRVNVPREVRLHEFSIQDHKKVEKVFAAFRPDVVIHLAAQKNVRASVEDPMHDADVNILGTLNILQASVRQKVSRVVFASTGGAVYGDATVIPTPETYAPQPVSPYGISKRAVEYYLAYYYKQFGLKYSAMRYANVYGPRQDPHGEAGVVAIFIQKLLRGQLVTINGTGRQTRDYVYVGDVAAANLAGLSTASVGMWNVGTGKEIDVNTLYAMIARSIGVRGIAKHGPAKAGEQKRSAVHVSKIKKELRWKPSVSLEQGLQLTAAWYSQQR